MARMFYQPGQTYDFTRTPYRVFGQVMAEMVRIGFEDCAAGRRPRTQKQLAALLVNYPTLSNQEPFLKRLKAAYTAGYKHPDVVESDNR